MRSLPPPRQSRYRTIKRIWRSLLNLITSGYISDSQVFKRPKPSNLLHRHGHRQTHNHNHFNKTTKIRKSRLTKLPTSRKRVTHRVSNKIVNELNDVSTDAVECVNVNNSELIISFFKWFKLFKLWNTKSVGGISSSDDTTRTRTRHPSNVNFSVCL
ncbi:hypothetical protein CANARDRAFT_30366 [[Candida] arabinofermentans NRRL YB-2248]|uniref:Uncharacterized protein n=1 Tax=[Candida] arabinofermentans NRRL YB-2248 TaxID=983967 RepID=A0A1E4SUB8_9ASCO|nr:hypothetical protein CANARDRAFT_30366 [[Candida] arabinofermentans NRRL YB-2248]